MLEDRCRKDTYLALLVTEHHATQPFTFLLGTPDPVQAGDMLAATDQAKEIVVRRQVAGQFAAGKLFTHLDFVQTAQEVA